VTPASPVRPQRAELAARFDDPSQHEVPEHLVPDGDVCEASPVAGAAQRVPQMTRPRGHDPQRTRRRDRAHRCSMPRSSTPWRRRAAAPRPSSAPPLHRAPKQGTRYREHLATKRARSAPVAPDAVSTVSNYVHEPTRNGGRLVRKSRPQRRRDHGTCCGALGDLGPSQDMTSARPGVGPADFGLRTGHEDADQAPS